jgi:hypothetical protein
MSTIIFNTKASNLKFNKNGIDSLIQIFNKQFISIRTKLAEKYERPDDNFLMSLQLLAEFCEYKHINYKIKYFYYHSYKELNYNIFNTGYVDIVKNTVDILRQNDILISLPSDFALKILTLGYVSFKTEPNPTKNIIRDLTNTPGEIQ